MHTEKNINNKLTSFLDPRGFLCQWVFFILILLQIVALVGIFILIKQQIQEVINGNGIVLLNGKEHKCGENKYLDESSLYCRGMIQQYDNILEELKGQRVIK